MNNEDSVGGEREHEVLWREVYCGDVAMAESIIFFSFPWGITRRLADFVRGAEKEGERRGEFPRNEVHLCVYISTCLVRALLSRRKVFSLRMVDACIMRQMICARSLERERTEIEREITSCSEARKNCN